MEMETMLGKLTASEILKNACSIIRGNRNYCVRTEIRPHTGELKATVGRMGQMKKGGYIRCYLFEMVERDINWFYFTYKKDLENFLNQLEENNVDVYWIP